MILHETKDEKETERRTSTRKYRSGKTKTNSLTDDIVGDEVDVETLLDLYRQLGFFNIM